MQGTQHTSSEVAHAFRSNKLREIWNKTKKQLLEKTKQTFDAKTAQELEKAFNAGLGPLCDTWDKECDKFPKLNLTNLATSLVQAEKTVKEYKARIRKVKGGDMAAEAILDSLVVEMKERRQWYVKNLPK